MKYREFGGHGFEVSALGFGCMRLPTLDGRGNMLSADVDEAEAVRMIRHAVDRGVNFIDTAYPYHLGRSEVVVGKALGGGYREKVKLSTKLPVWSVKSPGDFDRFLGEQLEKLRTDHIDLYMFHSLGPRSWKTVVDLDLLERAEAAVGDGRIGLIGFSFHGDFECFRGIVDGYDRWAACLIQYNYMDMENQAGTKGLLYAASKGLAVAVMEPLLGGNLASPPSPVMELFDRLGAGHTPADLALKWLWNQPEVSVVLSGMSSMEQLRANLRSAGGSAVGLLGRRELELIDLARGKFRELAAVPCTRCGYCMPCPQGVDIPGNLEMYNDGFMYGDWEEPRLRYARTRPAERADRCDGCGECGEKCPQDIRIPGWMPKVREALEG